MTKKILALVLAALMAMSVLAACGSSTEAPAQPASGETAQTAAAEKLELVTTTSQVTGGSTQRLQEALTAAAEGSELISFKHYDNSTLFKSSEEFQALLDHDVDIAYLPTSYFYDNGANWCDMYSSTYLFNSPQQIREYFDPYSETGKVFAEKVYEEFHFMPIVAFDLGTRNLWISKDIDVNSPADLNGILCRVPNGASWVKMGNSIGVSPVSMDSNEVYLGMQTGTIDAQENNMITSYANSLLEVTKTIVLTKHVFNFNLVCIAGDVWDAMDDAQRSELIRIVTEGVDANNEVIWQMEADILAEAEEKGVRIQEPDLAPFISYGREYYLADPDAKNWDMDIYESIINMA